MATPMDQDDPVGSSVTLSDMPSVSDILCAHKTTSSWKLFAGNHFTALCHDRGCALCATYMLHLTQGANAGDWVPNPKDSSTHSRKHGLGSSDASARMRPKKSKEPIEPSIGWRKNSPP